MLRWTRRSRAGWAWADGVDAPLAEERERYAVTIAAPAGPTATIETVAAMLALPTRPAAGTIVAVRQCGTIAVSRAATLIIEEE